VCDLETQGWGGHDPRWVAAPQKKNTLLFKAESYDYKCCL